MDIAIVKNRVRNLVKTKGKKAGSANPQIEKSVDAHVYAERVERKAYELYEKGGRQDGQDWNDWFEAEKLVEADMINEDR